MLITTTPDGSWGWVGLRLAPARALAEHRGYLDLAEEERRRQAVAAELAWLQAQCRPAEPDGSGPGAPTRFDLRYTGGPGGLLRCVLLAQTVAGAPEAAERGALALRQRLAALPGHVAAAEILEPSELLAELDPLDTVARGTGGCRLVEIRRRLTPLPLQRPDTNRESAVLVADFEPSGVSWEPLWAELASSPVPVVLSVALEPIRLGPGEVDLLRRYAGEYHRLAAAGLTAPPWQRTLPGSPAAAAGAGHFDQALRRVAFPGYRLRITLAAAGALPARLAQLVAGTIGGPGAGAGAVVLDVAPPEQPAGWQNLTALDLVRLDRSYQQGLHDRDYGPGERLLDEFCTPTEAAAALRLPYEVAAHRPLFDDRFRTRQAATASSSSSSSSSAPAVSPSAGRPPL
ncbi:MULTISPECIES: hypothetical protein [unclassified Kitasatospora]|uniref:hypothetical protein n=1 Tax=unclassified Kitasatospora TaxID=2633591 RepID=UPI002474C49C|nr:hypothetical protein [Kitasatospora sp. MAP12-44]